MKELDPLLHSQLRLSVMSLLLSVEEADFVWLKEKTEATSGNLSVQIDKLAGKKPRTTCAMTEKGRQAMDVYISTLREYLHI